MLVLISETPEYCPRCGLRLNVEDRPAFLNGQSIICRCGCGLQATPVDTILEVAEEEGGDLNYMDLSLDMPCNSDELDIHV